MRARNRLGQALDIMTLDNAAAILSRHGYEDTAAELRELQAELERLRVPVEVPVEDDPELLRGAHLAAGPDPRRGR